MPSTFNPYPNVTIVDCGSENNVDTWAWWGPSVSNLLQGLEDMTPEGKVKKRVKDMLQAFDVYSYAPMTGGFGNSGIPDIQVCAWGRYLTIECKAGNNRPTALQQREIEHIRDAGGTALVINEDNLDELAVLLASWRDAYEQSVGNDPHG